MKTAMQDMLEWIEQRFNNPQETEVFKKATELIEKEKEQIIEIANKARETTVENSIWGFKYKPEEIYSQYNQKKQPMKLYTEKQVIEAYLGGASPNSVSEEDINWQLKKLTPIELPTDEEIEKKSYKLFHQNDNIGKGTWIYGAIWMKEQILNQNK